MTIVILLAFAFAVRAASYFEAPRPLADAGLAGEQAEIARNIVDHGRWFVVNQQAYALIKTRQAQEHRMVDLSRIDFSRVDRESRAGPEVDQMPGVAVILAGLWWLTGNKTYSPIQWLQILLDTAMVLLIYWVAIRLTRRTSVALIAALLYAVWPYGISYAKRPLLDTWAVFFSIACVAAFVWLRERPTSRRRLALLGIIGGLGIYFRPLIVILPIALALVATPDGGWRRRLSWIAAPTVIALLLLTPWTIRNYYEFHRFIPTRTGLGQAIFQGSGESPSDEQSARDVHQHLKNATYGSPSYDNFLFGSAIHAIASHPSVYLHRVAHRMRFLIPSLLVLLVWRRWRSNALIPFAAAVAIIGPYVLIGDDSRYYLPAAFADLILIAMMADLVLSSRASAARYVGWATGVRRGTPETATSPPQPADGDGRSSAQ